MVGVTSVFQCEFVHIRFPFFNYNHVMGAAAPRSCFASPKKIVCGRKAKPAFRAKARNHNFLFRAVQLWTASEVRKATAWERALPSPFPRFFEKNRVKLF